MDRLDDYVLHIIYNLLAPVYRMQFAVVCTAFYKIAEPSKRDIGAIIKARLPHPYLLEVFKQGGKLVGNFLLDCLYDTNYHQHIDILFDVGVDIRIQHGNVFNPANIDSDKYKAVDKFSNFIKGISTVMGGVMHVGEFTIVFLDGDELTRYSTKMIQIGDVACRIVITNPGISNYFNQCMLQFYHVLYDGDKLTAIYPTSVINKQSSIINTQDLCAYKRYIDEVGYILKMERVSLPETWIDTYVGRGFTITKDPSQLQGDQ